MFISARTERIEVTRSITQPISASAATSVKSGAISGSIAAGIAGLVRCRGCHQRQFLRRHRDRLARPWRQRQQRVAAARHLPQLFGDEGHEGVQQLQNLVARPGDRGAGLGLGRALLAEQHRLAELDAIGAVKPPMDCATRMTPGNGWRLPRPDRHTPAGQPSAPRPAGPPPRPHVRIARAAG